MTDLLAAWRACHVRRWHANPDMSHVDDTLGAHQGRVALLALCLFPTAHAVHRAAPIHDIGEAAAGDVPSPVKEANPVLKAELDRIEALYMRSLNLPTVNLGHLDAEQLELADRLDAYLLTRMRAPHVLHGDGWPERLAWMRATGWKLRVGAMIEAVLK